MDLKNLKTSFVTVVQMFFGNAEVKTAKMYKI